MADPAKFAVVLAAGKGTRMKSDLAKVLHPVAGRPMISHVLSNLASIETRRCAVIVGHQAERVVEICAEFGVETALQEPQLGTGHAVLQAKKTLSKEDGYTLILCGDVPLLRAQTLERLFQETLAAGAAGAVLTAITDDATGYGRILRDGTARVLGIVEEKDATDEQRKLREYNSGTYCFRNDLLWPALEEVGSENVQGEFYLTDVVGILAARGEKILGVICGDERELQGVNTVEDLERAEADFLAMQSENES
jgi:bifunctional UDP-N-acetylglucosamine pyrophosphorylase/glucosamine-1-phosphate N-acetyltransferase